MTDDEQTLRMTDKRAPASFVGLRRIVAMLRGPGGCPWDRVQTHQSLAPYLLEETHETLEAVDSEDSEKLCEELGDLLFEVLIQVQLAEEAGAFTIRDVIGGVTAKLLRRHPHVFGDAVAETPEAVIEQWDELKASERGDQSVLAGIPPSLPALARAQAIQRRAARAGFSYETEDQVWLALEEELAELREAGTPADKRDEVGDALFALANLARELGVDAEDALLGTSRRFAEQFGTMEAILQERQIDLTTAPVEQKGALWDEARTRRD